MRLWGCLSCKNTKYGVWAERTGFKGYFIQDSPASGPYYVYTEAILRLFIRKSEIEYYAMLAKTGVHHYGGNNIELGTACGKYFRCCTLSITDPGEFNNCLCLGWTMGNILSSFSLPCGHTINGVTVFPW